MAIPDASSYIVSKLAVHRFTELVALENPNVQVVALHPGSVMSSIVADMSDFAHFARDKGKQSLPTHCPP
jgi:NAD(P)-dependent dehydrogenase (short-subunit alcohol dehydrogenase family)